MNKKVVCGLACVAALAVAGGAVAIAIVKNKSEEKAD